MTASGPGATPMTTRWPKASRAVQDRTRPRRGPWQGLDDLELATLEYLDWFNHRRLHGQIGMIAPVARERAFYQQQRAQVRGDGRAVPA